MYMQHRIGLVLLALLTAISMGGKPASAQFETGFEAPLYSPGPLEFQDNWEPFGANYPRVQTADQIAQELETAGLNALNPVHSGNQAMLYTYNPPDETGVGGGFMRRRFTGLEEETRVIMEWWARPLTPGEAGSTIGFNLGNTFMGIQDDIDSGDGGRAAALRFGNWAVDGGAIVRSIDWASNDVPPGAPGGVWVASGFTWEADTWYNFQFHLDYDAKVYDLYINGTKANDDPIVFYRPTSKFASTVFVSRGTNQAGQIIDDISVRAAAATLPGDFNGDGKVDAADYVVWRKTDGSNQAKFDEWRSHFGAMSLGGGSGMGVVATVPEPTNLVLVLLASACVAARKRRFWQEGEQ